MWTTLAVWFVFSFAIHLFVDPLNTILILGFPLGFYMAAQGSLIILVALIRSEDDTSSLQSLMRIPYAVFCIKKTHITHTKDYTILCLNIHRLTDENY